MAFRKKTFRKKTNYRRRRFINRRKNTANKPKTYLFKRRVITDMETTGGSITDFNGYNFSLDDVPNYTEFEDMFDRFKISAVKLQFMPVISSVDSMTPDAGQPKLEFISSYVDYNDTNTPTSINEVLENQYCKITRGTKIHTRYLKPMHLTGDAITSFGQSRSWLNMIHHNTPHYGVKVASQLNVIPTSQTTYGRLIATYYLAFRDPK